MGIKLHGFLCDNCRIFTTFTGVKSSHVDLKLLEDEKNNEKVLSNLSYAKIPNWHYYNIIEESNNEWFKAKKDFKCYCPRCARILKLNKIISKI